MSLRLLALNWDVPDPATVADFWSRILDRPTIDESSGVLLPGSETQVSLRFVQGPAPASGLDRVHLHLTSATPADQQDTVSTALALGARHLDLGQQREEGHIVLADPAGDPFCVIEAGNAYLAGCGFLGELACDGSRSLGLFWAEALGWPLVWEQDEETAVQSPAGGTKVAWGGPPLEPKLGRSRQRLEVGVAATDVAAELDRLLTLGATTLTSTSTGHELADPDGNEFHLTAL